MVTVMSLPISTEDLRTVLSQFMSTTILARVSSHTVYQMHKISTRSRSLHINCLGRGSNSYSPRYWSSALI